MFDYGLLDGLSDQMKFRAQHTPAQTISAKHSEEVSDGTASKRKR